jgi:hypothetical protein
MITSTSRFAGIHGDEALLRAIKTVKEDIAVLTDCATMNGKVHCELKKMQIQLNEMIRDFYEEWE